MAETVLKNETLTLTIAAHGAEMVSLKNADGKEYLWNADPAWWKRHAPVLFPLVGSLKGRQYRVEGKTYAMGQHGFARDMDFDLMFRSDDECWYRLTETMASHLVYPYSFNLDVGYGIDRGSVKVMWRVTNPGTRDLYFSLGGHPAFVCPFNKGEKRSDCLLRVDTKEPLVCGIIGEGGTLSKRKKSIPTEDGDLAISDDLFEEDALILEDNQIHRVSLVDSTGKEYVTVSADTPLFGIWSQRKKGKRVPPFVCLEPWYGRCDAEDFSGTWEQREWGNVLAPGEEFRGGYTIEIR